MVNVLRLLLGGTCIDEKDVGLALVCFVNYFFLASTILLISSFLFLRTSAVPYPLLLLLLVLLLFLLLQKKNGTKTTIFMDLPAARTKDVGKNLLLVCMMLIIMTITARVGMRMIPKYGNGGEIGKCKKNPGAALDVTTPTAAPPKPS